MLRALAAASVALSLALLLPACGATKAPKQVEAPDALADKGADMATGDDTNGGMVKDTGGKSGAEQMHEKCCGECKAALAKDRTGQKAEAIPCTDFTDGLDPLCLEHFRGKKTMASECK
jgi:hypothetical protein